MDRSGNRIEVVIPKEKAVFWMDGAGRWCNRHGHFQHKKIIDHFNASIQRDDKGFYLIQHRDDIIEKVYFSHAETALFAVDFTYSDPSIIRLNTGIEFELIPEALFIFGDDLFYQMGNELVKFNQRALLIISEKISRDQERYVLKIQSESITIEERKNLARP